MDRSRSPPRVRVSIPPVSEWTFVKTSTDGVIPTSMVIRHGGKIIEMAVNNVVSPFEPSSFIENCYRKSLTLRLPTEWADPFECMEACLRAEVSQQATRFFDTPQTPEQIEEMYSPVSKKVGDYPRNLRCKINTTGSTSTRYWAADKTHMKAPETLVNTRWNARVVLNGLWFSGDKWGLVIDATDLMIVEEPAFECPF